MGFCLFVFVNFFIKNQALNTFIVVLVLVFYHCNKHLEKLDIKHQEIFKPWGSLMLIMFRCSSSIYFIERLFLLGTDGVLTSLWHADLYNTKHKRTGVKHCFELIKDTIAVIHLLFNTHSSPYGCGFSFPDFNNSYGISLLGILHDQYKRTNTPREQLNLLIFNITRCNGSLCEGIIFQ